MAANGALIPLCQPSCAAGYTRTGSNCAGTAGVPGGYLLETNAAGCRFRNFSSVTTCTATATSTCCRVPGRWRSRVAAVQPEVQFELCRNSSRS